jgi:hypothetical protein
MDKVEALKDLLAKIEAGDDAGVLDRSYDVAELSGSRGRYVYIVDAHNGSLDAAKSLHDDVLPEWDWIIGVGGATVVNPDENEDSFHGNSYSSNPARAWLCAIVKALIAAEDV